MCSSEGYDSHRCDFTLENQLIPDKQHFLFIGIGVGLAALILLVLIILVFCFTKRYVKNLISLFDD